jgi:DNA-binding transcriptional MerR regulator
MAPKLFTTTYVAAKIGVTRQTLYNWADMGLIDAPEPLAPGVRLWNAEQLAEAQHQKGRLPRGRAAEAAILKIKKERRVAAAKGKKRKK